MEDDQMARLGVCGDCACSQTQAMINARALGFEEEFQNGVYTCCQLDRWIKEQWLAWLEAGREELQKEVEGRLDANNQSEEAFVPVRIRRRQREAPH